MGFKPGELSRFGAAESTRRVFGRAPQRCPQALGTLVLRPLRRPSPSTCRPQLTGGPHPRPGPGALQLTAVAVHAPAVTGAAMALGGHVLPVLVALGDKHPRGQGALARHPRRPEDVFSLELTARLLCFCQGDKRRGHVSGGVSGDPAVPRDPHTQLRTTELPGHHWVVFY